MECIKVSGKTGSGEMLGSEDLVRMNKVLRHRLRNFASGIKNAAKLIAVESENCMPPDILEYFPLIVNECDQLDLLTQRMSMLFDHVPSGDTQRVGPLIEGLLHEWHQVMPTADIAVVMEPGILDHEIRSSHRVLCCLREIMANALEASGQTGVQVGVCRVEGCLELSVMDAGSGCEDLEQIFLPFFTTKSRHTGIGLAIARRMAEKVGGVLQAVCNARGGLTLTLRLPRVA